MKHLRHPGRAADRAGRGEPAPVRRRGRRPEPGPRAEAALRAGMGRVDEGMRGGQGGGPAGRVLLRLRRARRRRGGSEGYVALAGGRVLSAATWRAQVLASCARRRQPRRGRRLPLVSVRLRPGPGRAAPARGRQRYFSCGAAARFPTAPASCCRARRRAPSHEWEEFQAGVFSHEVRSALLGRRRCRRRRPGQLPRAGGLPGRGQPGRAQRALSARLRGQPTAGGGRGDAGPRGRPGRRQLSRARRRPAAAGGSPGRALGRPAPRPPPGGEAPPCPRPLGHPTLLPAPAQRRP